MEGAFSTCMGVVLRHAGQGLKQQYTVIDNIERLPERLPELFIALTK